MACLNFIFFNKARFTINLYNASSLFQRPVYSLHFKKSSSRIYSNSSRSSLKPASKPITLYLYKTHNVSCNKIINYHAKPIRIHELFRHFHTSERRYFHPIVWAVLRPVLKLMAVLTGRAFRKWWRDLPLDKKKYFLQSIKENKNKLFLYAIICVILSMVYYISHIEETPITKRRRFIAFNSKQLEKINQFEFEQIIKAMKKDMFPVNHPLTHRVQAVVDRIIKANWDLKEVKDKHWHVAVINSSVENAFVVPTGLVCVFAGMLSLCTNDDELGVILSHEIAHCIQGHGAEKVSFGHLLDLISVVIIGFIWALIPSDSLSILAHWIYSKSMQIFFELPYNRKIEKEADFVGLKLAAKACFDVRESSAFWAKMAILQDTLHKAPDIEFLSTHPSHETRSEYLDSIMDKAVKFRSECGCPKLKSVDPRLNIEIMAKTLEAARQKYLVQCPKPSSPFYV